MKKRFLRVCILLGFAMILGASTSTYTGVGALTDIVREAEGHNTQEYKKSYFYSNGAVRSINNLTGTTYNFSDTDFDSTVGTYRAKLLEKVNKDDTDEVFEKPRGDNLAELQTMLKMPSRKLKWLTNYNAKELKELGLTKVSEDTSEELQENIIDSSAATTGELVSALSYLIDKDYYTIPYNMSVVKAQHSHNPVSGSVSLPAETATWLNARHNESGVAVNTDITKSDLIMTLSKIYKGVQQSSAVGFSDNSERNGVVWTTVNSTGTVTPDGPFSSALNAVASGATYYGSTTGYYDLLSGSVFSGTYGGGRFDGTQNAKYKLVPATTNYGVQFQGDYWIYYDPNVYELYLSQAVNDGIIQVSDLASTGMGAKLKADLKSSSSTVWRDGRLLLDGKARGSCLGYSKSVSNGSGSFSVSSRKPTYFGDAEKMTTMEALRLIEAYMRANDENMSKTEESIVQYKLGLNVLSFLDDDDSSTITYLVATGILDCDDDSIVNILYDSATLSSMYPLLYRVANKDARTNFDTIKLTDSETFWAAEGFSESKVGVLKPEDEIIHETTKVAKKSAKVSKVDVDTEDNKEVSLLARLFGVSPVNAATPVVPFTVEKCFDVKSVYKIGNTSIANLKDSKDEQKKYGITEFKEDTLEYAGKKHKVYQVTFEVDAKNKATAIAAVDNRITVTSELNKYKKSVYGVSRVTKGDVNVTLVSQESLKQAFTNIAVLEDKILMNTSTGTLAYFSYDNNTTLVGSQIITSNYPCITKAGNKIYYNLDAIITLLSSAYVDVIGMQSSVIVDDIAATKTVAIGTDLMDSEDYLLNAQYLKMYTCADTSNNQEDDIHNGFACIANKNTKKALSKFNKDINFYVKLNTLSSVTNKLTKSFSVNYNGSKISGTIVVDFNFVVPQSNTFTDWVGEEIFNTDTLTYQQATQILCTPPDKIPEIDGLKELAPHMATVEKSALSTWWYSNYGMANALCNFLYGTSGNVYIPSGYIVPSVTLLVNPVGTKTFDDWCGGTKGKSTMEIRDSVLAQIFSGFQLGPDYLKYNNNTQNKFWHNFYKCDTDDPDFTDVGFSNINAAIKSTIASSRQFTILGANEPESIKANIFGQHANKIAKCAMDQRITTFGRLYAVSSTGAVYENVAEMGTAKQKLFAYTTKVTDGEKDSLSSLTLNSRSSKRVTVPIGFKIGYNTSTLRYGGFRNSKQVDANYYALYPRKLFSSGTTPASQNFKLKLATSNKSGSGALYKVVYVKADGTTCELEASNSLVDVYMSSYTSIFGNGATIKRESLIAMLKSNREQVLVAPAQLSGVTTTIRGVLGSGKTPVYLYTDVGISKVLEHGQIFKWDGKLLTVCDTATSLKEIRDSGANVYAMPLYLLNRDKYFIDDVGADTAMLHGDVFNKSLNFLPYDLTSLNNQLIDAYLLEQRGVMNANKLPEKATVRIGDTVWMKNGEWWQSKPIKNSKAKSLILNPTDLNSYSNTLFGGQYITVQGRQYSVQLYSSDMQMGALVGTSKQMKKGIVYWNGSSVMFRKGNVTKKATSKTKTTYVSIKCKFNDALLVRPVDDSGMHYTILGHAGTGLVSSAAYPFFDDEASWARTKSHSFQVSTSDFKPSAAFIEAKNEFLAEFKAKLAEDAWNYVWVVILILASYLMVMSWLAYGVIGLGVGRAGFEALMLRDGRSGTHHGIDFMKLLTFGLYSIDRDVSLGRMITVSFGCCIVILTVLVLIF